MANSINPDGYGFGLLPGSSSPFWRGDETPPIGALADVQTAGVRDQFVLLYDILSKTWIAKPLVDDSQSSDYTTYSAKKIEELIANIEGGGSGTNDYDQLINKPAVNGITLSGDKTLDDFGIQGKLTAVGYISIDNMNRISVNIPIDDEATDADHLWSAQKIANMLSTKANINAFENYYTKTQMDTVLDSKVDETEFNELEDIVDDIKYYSGLLGKPSINGHELLGNKTSQELGIIANHEIVLPATGYPVTQFLTNDKLGTGICIVDAASGNNAFKFVGAYNIADLNSNYVYVHLFRQYDFGQANDANSEMQLEIKGSALFPASAVGSIATVRVRSCDENTNYDRNSFVISNVQFIPIPDGSNPVDLTLEHTQYVKTAAELGTNIGMVSRLSIGHGFYATLNVDGIQLSIESSKYAVTFINDKRYFTKLSTVVVDGVTKAQIDIYGEEALVVTPATISLTINSITDRTYVNDWSANPLVISGLDATKTNHYVKLSIMNTEFVNLIDGTTATNPSQYNTMLHLITSADGTSLEFTSIDFGNSNTRAIITSEGWNNGTLTINKLTTDISLEGIVDGLPGVDGLKIDVADVAWGIISEF